MKFQVASHRLPFPLGSTVDAEMLGDANIDALVQAGHLVGTIDTSLKQKNLKTETIGVPEPLSEPESKIVESDGNKILTDYKEL